MVIEITDYVASIKDYVLVFASTSDLTITLPTSIGNEGKEVNVTKRDSTSKKVIINTILSQTINGELTQTINNQYTNATFVSDGTNWVIK